MSITFASISKPDEDPYVPTAVGRDRWGRPLIVPEGGGKAVPYTRISTLAKTLDDTEGLSRWKCRQVAAGIAARPDLHALAVSARGDKQRLGEVVEQAMEAAASGSAANVGTALHTFTELVDQGETWSHAPHDMHADLAAYAEAIKAAGLVAVDFEQFVVNDELQAAGSYDRRWQFPDRRIVIGDLKTGADAPRYAQGAATQMAVYARSVHYDPATGARRPFDVDTTVGLLIHLPVGQARCDIYEIDLVAGWSAALIATTVRQWRKANPATLMTAQP